MPTIISSTLEFLVYHFLISLVDRVSRLPRHSTPPELERLYRENIALKSQVRALVLELKATRGKRPRVSMHTRAAQALAFLLTRGDKAFQAYYLSASRPTIKTWLTRFCRGPFQKKARVGRPPLAQEIVDLIVTFRTENPAWGSRRIREELRRMAIKVSEPTIQKVLREHGFFPPDGRPYNIHRFRSTAKDLIWALDFFAVRTAKGIWVKALLIIDLHTREFLDLRVFDGWEADSVWTIQTLSACMAREGRKPEAVIHDHGSQFYGQFERQLRVLEVEQRRTPVALPFVNGQAERAVKSVRLELLNHVRARDSEELQWYLDEYQRYTNGYRANQAIDGQTPEELAAEKPKAEVIDLAAIRQKRLVRHSFAHGLLNAYELVGNEQGNEPAKQAA